MSTRRSVFCTKRVHVFYDVVEGAHYIDIGKRSYNRAFLLWPWRGHPFRLY